MLRLVVCCACIGGNSFVLPSCFRLVNKEHLKLGDSCLSRNLHPAAYQEMNNCEKHMPIRWMAIESLTDDHFSSQSDVVSLVFAVARTVLITSCPIFVQYAC